MRYITVDKLGRITIPAKMRKQLGWEAGDHIQLTWDGYSITMKKVHKETYDEMMNRVAKEMTAEKQGALEILGSNLKEWRRLNRVSRERMAHERGLSDYMLRKIEAGQDVPIDTLFNLGLRVHLGIEQP